MGKGTPPMLLSGGETAIKNLHSNTEYIGMSDEPTLVAHIGARLMSR